MAQNRELERHETDILILGSGGAGLFAALHAQRAARPGTRVTVAVKGLLGKCGCTRMVQGGYNVALGPGDSVERHFMDTVVGGSWLPDQEMAWKLCSLAVERVHELENEIGCFFDRDADGRPHLKAFAGQSADRTVHKGDLTGIEIINRLMEQVLRHPIERLEEHRAIALIRDPGGRALAGVLFIDVRRGVFRFVRAQAVLMATGGGPTMYRYHTPSGDKSMDGLAMAMAAGLALRDMEMVQFHPTGLLAGEHTRMTGTVLEEGLRGAGGHLLNAAGERFMFDYDPRGERATRDLVSRAMFDQMRAGGGISIAMSHLGPAQVRRRFAGMVKRCADCGFDLAGERVPVVPTAHYFMGGVVVDCDTRTALEGLYVAGEDAGGAHGSNRLGGNGVANSTVYGGVAGDTMVADLAAREPAPPPCEAQLGAAVAAALRPLRGGRSAALPALREQLQAVMWRDVGVIRTRAGLERALAEVRALATALDHCALGCTERAFNPSWHDWLNLRSLIAASELIALAALSRENSRGAHHREDFPEPGALEASCFTRAQRGDGGDGPITLRHDPVRFTRVAPGQSLIDAAEPRSLLAPTTASAEEPER